MKLELHLTSGELLGLKKLIRHGEEYLDYILDQVADETDDTDFTFSDLSEKVVAATKCSQEQTELYIRLSATHNLKCDPEFFQAVLDKKKPFEVRNNDRDFHVGDFINLLEFDRGTSSYTGREIKAIKVTYVLKDYAVIADGYVVLGLDANSY